VESVLAVAAETVAEPTREPTFEDVVSKAFTPPRNPEFEVVLHAGPATEEAEVDGTLVWPANSPLEGLPELVWPTEESQEETPDLVWPAEPTVGDQGGPMAVDLVVDLPSSPPLPESPDLVWPAESINDPVDTEFMSERLSTTAQESPVLREAPDRAPASRSSAAWVIEDVPDLPPVMAASASSAAPPLPKVPDATASTEHPPLFVAPVKSAPARTQDVEVPTKATRTRAGQRKRIRRQFSRQTATTILLLGVLALAVALVLAQSAGLVHLGFLGSPA
jgi:hypothetical protein